MGSQEENCRWKQLRFSSPIWGFEFEVLYSGGKCQEHPFWKKSSLNLTVPVESDFDFDSLILPNRCQAEYRPLFRPNMPQFWTNYPRPGERGEAAPFLPGTSIFYARCVGGPSCRACAHDIGSKHIQRERALPHINGPLYRR